MTLEDYIDKDVEITLMSDGTGSERMVGRVVQSRLNNRTTIFFRHNSLDSTWNGSRPLDSNDDGYNYWMLNSRFVLSWYKDITVLGVGPKMYIKKHNMAQ